MSKHSKPKWLNMWPIIVHFGFCGSEKAYRKAMKRMGHNIGAGSSSELLQAEPSNLAMELMLKKENQAVMIGAQLSG